MQSVITVTSYFNWNWFSENLRLVSDCIQLLWLAKGNANELKKRKRKTIHAIYVTKRRKKELLVKGVDSKVLVDGHSHEREQKHRNSAHTHTAFSISTTKYHSHFFIALWAFRGAGKKQYISVCISCHWCLFGFLLKRNIICDTICSNIIKEDKQENHIGAHVRTHTHIVTLPSMCAQTLEDP